MPKFLTNQWSEAVGERFMLDMGRPYVAGWTLPNSVQHWRLAHWATALPKVAGLIVLDATTTG